MLRNMLHAAAGQIIRNLWNDHIGLIDGNPIPFSQLKALHNADIVNAGPAHRSSLQFHRFKHSHRIDQTRSGGAPLDIGKGGFPNLILPLKCDGIARKFRRASQ